jgi:hypothetical protein
MKNGPHILVCSDSGTGKSTFAATAIDSRNPRPVLVQLFDPRDKGTPYRRRGNSVAVEDWEYGQRERVFVDGKEVAIIERWHERQGYSSSGITMKGGKKVGTLTKAPEAGMFERYLDRMRFFEEEQHDYFAFVLDSTTFMELAVRAFLASRMRVSDNQMIWAQAADELERFLVNFLPDLDITTIVLAHVNPEPVADASGVQYVTRLPGRLKRDLQAAFGEVYRAYTVRHSGESGTEDEYLLQTRPDGKWRCSSQLGVPDPMPQDFRYVRKAFTGMVKNRPHLLAQPADASNTNPNPNPEGAQE